MNTSLLVASVPGSVELWMLPPYLKKNKKKKFTFLTAKKSYGFLFTVISKKKNVLDGKIGFLEFSDIKTGEHIPIYTPLFNWNEASDRDSPDEIYVTITALEYKYMSLSSSVFINTIKSDLYYKELLEKMNYVTERDLDYSYFNKIGEDMGYIAESYFKTSKVNKLATIANHFSIPERTLASRSIDTVSVSTLQIDLKFELIISDMADTNKNCNNTGLFFDLQNM